MTLICISTLKNKNFLSLQRNRKSIYSPGFTLGLTFDIVGGGGVFGGCWVGVGGGGVGWGGVRGIDL